MQYLGFVCFAGCFILVVRTMARLMSDSKEM